VIVHRDIAVLVTRAALLQQVGGVGHGLLPAGHDDLELPGADELVGQGDGVNPRQAHLVDGQSRHGHRDAGLDGSLAGGDLAGAGRQHLAHDHVVHLVASHTGPLQRPLDGQATEFHSGEVLQGAKHATQGGARSGNDHRYGTFAHVSASNSKED